MKKTILVTVLILVTSVNVQAQLAKFGIKAGLNYANLTGTNITVNGTNYKKDAITSYHAGFVAEIKLLDKLSFQPELLYTTQGASYKNGITEIKNELGYIAIPLMAKIYLNDTFSLELGPQASFLLSGKNNIDVNNSNTFDFSIAAGIGIKLTENIFIQGRYGLGLTEVSPTAKTKNSVVQVSAGIMF